MSFLKPNLGRRNGDATAVRIDRREAVPHGWLTESFARTQGVLSAELDHLESVILDALQQAEHDAAEARSECADLRRRVELLERDHADALRKLDAVRGVLRGSDFP